MGHWTPTGIEPMDYDDDDDVCCKQNKQIYHHHEQSNGKKNLHNRAGDGVGLTEYSIDRGLTPKR